MMKTAGTTSRTLKAKPEDITIDLAACAVIVVDMQNAYLSKGGYLDLAGFDRDGAEDVVIAMRHLLADVRSAGVPIIYLQNGWDPAYREAGGPDSPNQMKSNALRLMRRRPELAGTLLAKGGWDYELRDEIAMQEGDILIQKSRYSGFVSTPLDSMLRSRGIKHLLVAGVATWIIGALARMYADHGDNAQAMGLYHRLLERDPRNVDQDQHDPAATDEVDVVSPKYLAARIKPEQPMQQPEHGQPQNWNDRPDPEQRQRTQSGEGLQRDRIDLNALSRP